MDGGKEVENYYAEKYENTSPLESYYRKLFDVCVVSIKFTKCIRTLFNWEPCENFIQSAYLRQNLLYSWWNPITVFIRFSFSFPYIVDALYR